MCGTIYRHQGQYETLMSDLVASNLRIRHNAHGGDTSATTIYGEYFGHEVLQIYIVHAIAHTHTSSSPCAP